MSNDKAQKPSAPPPPPPPSRGPTNDGIGNEKSQQPPLKTR